jgi:hypothetical protein
MKLITKMKGVNSKLNKMTKDDYEAALKKPLIGKNINLQVKNNIKGSNRTPSGIPLLSKITVQKNALTGVHTKAVVLSNHSCAPFVYDYIADLDYVCN